MITYSELYEAYTKAFTHTDAEGWDRDGNVILVTYQPQAPCNHTEIDVIIERLSNRGGFLTMAHIVNAMRETVGKPGPRKDVNRRVIAKIGVNHVNLFRH